MDERAKYFRRLKKLRGSARRWSVIGGGLTATTAVLTPYAGIGIPDAIWAGAAGASVMLAWWRWRDLREHAALPAPPALPPPVVGPRLTAALERFPVGRTVLHEVRRQRDRYGVRNSAAIALWDRLDRAITALAGLDGRLTGPGEEAKLEALAAESWLRDLGQRVAAVERAVPLSPSGQRAGLEEAHASLVAQFSEGVTAYEGLVAAVAGYVAEDGYPVVDGPHPAFSGLLDATDRLRGLVEGLSSLKRPSAPA